MSKKLTRSLLVGLALAMVLSVAPAAVFALDEGDSSETTTQTEQKDRGERAQKLQSELQALKEQREENREKRLETAKLEACEKRKAKVVTIMNRSITRAERQLELFTKIADRVKAFYVDKGYNLANYDELVAAVDAAKADAEANLETLKAQDVFDCSADDPKGIAEAFKLALHSVNDDLKDYRTAVKNLIVGVKSAHNAANDSAEEGGEE